LYALHTLLSRFRATVSVFEGFQLDRIDTGEASLRVRRGGSGPPLLLLQGSANALHVARGAPLLARDFTVVLTTTC
jgi:haloacetate dehalogenase